MIGQIVVKELLLTAKSLVRRYPSKSSFWSRNKDVVALDDVSVRVSQGEIVGIVGESGSGKSTLAKLLLGLESPTSGSVELLGRAIGAIPRVEVARILQPVFQDPYGSLNPSHTVERIVSLPLRMRDTTENRGSLRAETSLVLEQVGLPARVLDAYPHALSGGQRQRVSIARALAAQPRLLICDEPTSALDVSVQAQILNLLLELQRQLNLSIVLISHNLGVVGHMADRLYVMQNGKVVESGQTDAVFARPSHAYTQSLFSSMLELPHRRDGIGLGASRGQNSRA